ncbi:MAG: Mu transposase domain-containing protein [Candidatus Dormibacteraceae bacterium]
MELPAPWEDTLHLLNGRLPFSGKTRGVFAESEEEGHLFEAIDGVLRRLGGTARKWRIDRMSTAFDNKSGRVRPAFAAIARYYGAQVVPCPPFRAKRKGSVEKDNDFSAQRWFRTAQVGSQEQAQLSYDDFCASTGDLRPRRGSTVALLALQENLLAIPSVPYPVTIEDEREVGDSSLVFWRGNRYSINPGLEGSQVRVRHRVGTMNIEIMTLAGVLLATHLRHPDGGGTMVRLPEHQTALEKIVLANFSTARPCPRKVNRPPSAEALAAAARLRAHAERDVVVDLGRYAELIEETR